MHTSFKALTAGVLAQYGVTAVNLEAEIDADQYVEHALSSRGIGHDYVDFDYMLEDFGTYTPAID